MNDIYIIIIIILFILGNNYTIKIAALNYIFLQKKNQKLRDETNGSIPRAAILITD